MGLFGRAATTTALLLFMAPSMAQAITFDFSFGPTNNPNFIDTTFSGAGTFEASDRTPGQSDDFLYQIDSITGTVSNSLGGPTQTIDATNPFPGNGEFGNFLYENGTMTTLRVLFTTGGGSLIFDIISFTSAEGFLLGCITGTAVCPGSGSVSFNISPQAPSEVPLPAALPLFATILAGGGLIAWRRKRKAAKIAA